MTDLVPPRGPSGRRHETDHGLMMAVRRIAGGSRSTADRNQVIRGLAIWRGPARSGWVSYSPSGRATYLGSTLRDVCEQVIAARSSTPICGSHGVALLAAAGTMDDD